MYINKIETTLNVFDENGDGEIQFNEFKKVFDDIERDRLKQDDTIPKSIKPIFFRVVSK